MKQERITQKRVDVPGYDVAVSVTVSGEEVESISWQIPASERERFRSDTHAVIHPAGSHDTIVEYDYTPIINAVENVADLPEEKYSEATRFQCQDCLLGGDSLNKFREIRCRAKKHPMVKQKEAKHELLREKAKRLSALQRLNRMLNPKSRLD